MRAFAGTRGGMDPFCTIFVLIMFLRHINGLRCYAGNPMKKHECNSLSYCLLVTSKSGRTQWSCDGNAFSQVSLCSNLNLENPRHTIYESPPSRNSYFKATDPEPYHGAGDNRNERLYLIKQQIDPRLSQFVSDSSTTLENSPPPEAMPLNARRRSGEEDKKCFDGGDLGRICCCSTDFCNGASRVISSTAILLLPFLTYLLRL